LIETKRLMLRECSMDYDAFKEYLKESGSSEKAKGFAFIAY